MIKGKLLMLFVRKPELGKVKTRLAKDLGEEKALEIYIKLLEHTRRISGSLEADKRVYYAGEIAEQDIWDVAVYQKEVQPNGDLGQKMEYAFSTAFEEGYKAVVIIGSDCYELNQTIIEQAYALLGEHDVVLGPAVDGGYYLLGMKQIHNSFFRNKRWSTEHVFADTLADIRQSNLSYALLPTLSDVDHAKDVDSALLAS